MGEGSGLAVLVRALLPGLAWLFGGMPGWGTRPKLQQHPAPCHVGLRWPAVPAAAFLLAGKLDLITRINARFKTEEQTLWAGLG